MKKSNFLIPLTVLFLLPVMMLLQQKMMPAVSPKVTSSPWKKVDFLLMRATEGGLVYHRNHAQHVAYAAGVYAAWGKLETAEKWFKLGAEKFQYPSVMVYYGDHLTQHHRFAEARYWYNRAEAHAVKDRQKGFLFILRKKVELLNAAEKGAVKK